MSSTGTIETRNRATRAKASGAIANGITLALAGLLFVAAPAGAAIDLLGRTSVTYGWNAGAGTVDAYEVYVACAAGAPPTVFPATPTATIPPGTREYTIDKQYGDECAIRIVALDNHGFTSPASEGSDLVRFTAPPMPRIDLDADGFADLIVEDQATGEALVASGANLATGDDFDASLSPVGTGSNPDWVLLASGHFDLDAQEDFLWRITPAEGAETTTYVTGSSVQNATVHTTSTLDMGDVLVVGDFDGNFLDDLMFYDSTRGTLTCVFTKPGAANTIVDFPSVPPVRFDFVASGDFNGDSTVDLLWRKKTTGQTVAWLMHGEDAVDTAYSGALAAGGWVGESTGNFNNSTNSDVLWRNADTGETRIWYMDDLTEPVELSNVDTKGSDWELIGAGDVNGDGRDDVAWHNLTTNLIELWQMDEQAPAGYYDD